MITAEETVPDLIKRCLDSCGSDCNVVKVEHNSMFHTTGKCLKCPEINFEF